MSSVICFPIFVRWLLLLLLWMSKPSVLLGPNMVSVFMHFIVSAALRRFAIRWYMYIRLTFWFYHRAKALGKYRHLQHRCELTQTHILCTNTAHIRTNTFGWFMLSNGGHRQAPHNTTHSTAVASVDIAVVTVWYNIAGFSRTTVQCNRCWMRIILLIVDTMRSFVMERGCAFVVPYKCMRMFSSSSNSGSGCSKWVLYSPLTVSHPIILGRHFCGFGYTICRCRSDPSTFQTAATHSRCESDDNILDRTVWNSICTMTTK